MLLPSIPSRQAAVSHLKPLDTEKGVGNDAHQSQLLTLGPMYQRSQHLVTNPLDPQGGALLLPAQPCPLGEVVAITSR